MIVTCMQSAPARMNLRRNKSRMPLITVCHATKKVAATNAATDFPLGIKEMSSVTALPLEFCINQRVNM